MPHSRTGFSGLAAHGRGIAETRRRTPSIVGTAYDTWFFWDGHKDSQWSQALAPMEAANEMGGDRTDDARVLVDKYRDQYAALFGALPDVTKLPAHASPRGNPSAQAAWDSMSAWTRMR